MDNIIHFYTRAFSTPSGTLCWLHKYLLNKGRVRCGFSEEWMHTWGKREKGVRDLDLISGLGYYQSLPLISAL
jgi:hypothetical protein